MTDSDAAYYQNNANGSGVSSSRSLINTAAMNGTLGDATFLGLVSLPFLICQAIDDAKDAKTRKMLCRDLFRTLTNSDAPAYQWQSYFSRCQ